jgi:hypothetical protein
MTTWAFLIQGIGLGFAAAVQPGPFQAYLISRTLSRGWRRTLPAALAPLVSDGPIIVLCLFVLSRVPLWFQRFLYLAGGLFVLYLAYGAFRAWRTFEGVPPRTARRRGRPSFTPPDERSQSQPYTFTGPCHGPILLNGWRTPRPRDRLSRRLLCRHHPNPGGDHPPVRHRPKLGPKVNRAMIGVSALPWPASACSSSGSDCGGAERSGFVNTRRSVTPFPNVPVRRGVRFRNRPERRVKVRATVQASETRSDLSSATHLQFDTYMLLPVINRTSGIAILSVGVKNPARTLSTCLRKPVRERPLSPRS